MKIEFKRKKLRASLENEERCKKDYGADMAKKIFMRLATLQAANSLADFWPPKSGPERCHELKGERVGQFSIDLKQPYRLIFEAIEEGENIPTSSEDNVERWKSIKAINILDIEDTHG